VKGQLTPHCKAATCGNERSEANYFNWLLLSRFKVPLKLKLQLCKCTQQEKASKMENIK